MCWDRCWCHGVLSEGEADRRIGLMSECDVVGIEGNWGRIAAPLVQRERLPFEFLQVSALEVIVPRKSDDAGVHIYVVVTSEDLDD